jgi:hypothetical protein
MPDLQGVSALFRSLDAAMIANQAVQASEMAVRQGSASLQVDAQRRQAMVTQMLQSAGAAAVGGEGQPPERGGPGRRRRPRDPEVSGPPAPGSVHRIDLIA